MKIKDLMFECREDTLIGIKSLDHDEVFCFAEVDSDEIMPYANREVLQMSVNQHEFDFIEGFHYTRSYIEVLISKKEDLTLEEAIELVMTETVGYLNDDLEYLAIVNHRIDFLYEIKNKKLTVEEICKEERKCLFKIQSKNFSRSDYDAWIVYQQILVKMGIKKPN